MEMLMITKTRVFELKPDEFMNNGVPYCKKCKTARYFVREDFCVPCKCECQMEEIRNREEQEKQRKIAEYLQDLKSKSLLGERYKDCSFDKIEVINEDHQKVINRLKKYCEGFKEHNEGLGIYLFGTNGSGKTLLTACMLDKLNSQFIECMFTNIHKVKEELLSSDPKRQKSFLDRVYRVPVLFLDDFATEVVKKNGEDNWLQDIIYDIINTRYNNMLPIIYTSNCSLRECLEQRGILQKTIDRVFESTVQIKLDLPSYRLRKKENVYF
jgi:DNA replication protein DnaC